VTKRSTAVFSDYASVSVRRRPPGPPDRGRRLRLPPRLGAQDPRHDVAHTLPDGGAGACTGTLLADGNPATAIPSTLTAQHCFSDQTRALSVQSFWHLTTGRPGRGVVGNADVLHPQRSTDTALLRLRRPAPADAAFAALAGHAHARHRDRRHPPPARRPATAQHRPRQQHCVEVDYCGTDATRAPSAMSASRAALAPPAPAAEALACSTPPAASSAPTWAAGERAGSTTPAASTPPTAAAWRVGSQLGRASGSRRRADARPNSVGPACSCHAEGSRRVFQKAHCPSGRQRPRAPRPPNVRFRREADARSRLGDCPLTTQSGSNGPIRPCVVFFCHLQRDIAASRTVSCDQGPFRLQAHGVMG